MKVKITPHIETGAGLPLLLIAGPCVIESEALVMDVCGKLIEITKRLKIPYVFKASYDKANRSSVKTFRGPGMQDGLKILAKVKKTYNVPILTDIHETWQVKESAEVADILQIPAFLCRQTDLLVAAGETGKTVNIKKGQFLSPLEMKNLCEKVASTGNHSILMTERGTFFGYNNLVVDFRSLPIMRSIGYPIIFDATHSVQRPGGAGQTSGGDREFVPYLAKAAVAVGCDGLFMETHPHPDKALSDGPNMVPLKEMEALLEQLIQIHSLSIKNAPVTHHPKKAAVTTQAKASSHKVIIFTDGCSKGNPGRSGIGVVFMDANRNIIKTIAKDIGTATNNVAEYTALIIGLTEALKDGYKEIEIYADS